MISRSQIKTKNKGGDQKTSRKDPWDFGTHPINQASAPSSSLYA
jgi:hypothetical protein